MTQAPSTPLISIGILAWNEEDSLGATLASLGKQTLLESAAQGAIRLEVIVVPNGCADATARVATAALEQLMERFKGLMAAVRELDEGSKPNAWNQFIHQFSHPGADYFILMDADIELLTPGTLESLWMALEADQHAVVSTDVPVKHLAHKTRLSLLDRVLLGAGAMTKATPGQLTGQLYCARAPALREVVIPRGLIVEDGYLKQILCTRGFSEPVDNSRIVRAEGASHLFECYTRLRDIWNHQVRQAIGHTLFTYLTRYIREQVPDRPVQAKLRDLCDEDPGWFLCWVRQEVDRRGLWVMDTPSLTMRWRRVRNAHGSQKAKFILLAALAFPFDIAVFAVANQRLRSGQVKGIWKDTRTTKLPTP